MDEIPERDDDASQDYERQSAQAAAGELSRMGIDPSVLGLESVVPPSTPGPPPPGPPLIGGPLIGGPLIGGPRIGPPGVHPQTGGRLPAPPPEFAPVLPQGRTPSVLSRPLGGQPAELPGQRAPRAAENYQQAPVPAAPSPTAVMPARLHRAVRAVTFGLVQPGAAAAMERERELVARVRTRRREGRTVAFIAGKGGVGATTTALGTALTLAALRTDLTAVVDARHGTASIGRRLAGRSAPNVVDFQQRPEDGGVQAEPLLLDGRLGVVDGLPWYGPAPGKRVVQVLDHLKDRFTFTLADLGNDIDWAGSSVLARADQTVVVTTPYRDAAAMTRTTLGRIYRLDPQRLDTIVVAVVCLTARQFRYTARRLYEDLRLDPERLIPVPFDPHLVTGDAIQPHLLRPATREAYLRIAGVIASPGSPRGTQRPGPVYPVSGGPAPISGAAAVRGVAAVASGDPYGATRGYPRRPSS